MLKLMGFKFGKKNRKSNIKKWGQNLKKEKRKKDLPWPNCKSTYGLGIHLPIGILNTMVCT